MFHVMGGEGSMSQWVKHKPALAGPDYIHFTLSGAQEIGSDLAKSFTTYYDFFKLRQHVPSQKVLEFMHKNKSEDSILVSYKKLMPNYQPFKNDSK